jgi:hypothetical protein
VPGDGVDLPGGEPGVHQYRPGRDSGGREREDGRRSGVLVDDEDAVSVAHAETRERAGCGVYCARKCELGQRAVRRNHRRRVALPRGPARS